MKNRRDFLAATAAALPALVLAGCATNGQIATHANQLVVNSCKKPGGASAKYFPNSIVLTHESHKAWFYDDLIRGKIVGINFMSVKNEDKFPVTQNLVKVQELLGDRLGRDIFLVSITTDPEHDTPHILRKFADKYGVKSGWDFVTGKPGDIHALMQRYSAHGDHHGQAHVIRYGNETYNRWGSFHALARPEKLIQRFSWVDVKKPANSNA